MGGRKEKVRQGVQGTGCQTGQEDRLQQGSEGTGCQCGHAVRLEQSGQSRETGLGRRCTDSQVRDQPHGRDSDAPEGESGTGKGNRPTQGRKRVFSGGQRFFRREPSEVKKSLRMQFISIKTDDGRITGKIAFYCHCLGVSRQGFYWYLKHRNDPWK